MMVRRWSRIEVLKAVEDVIEKENLTLKQSIHF